MACVVFEMEKSRSSAAFGCKAKGRAGGDSSDEEDQISYYSYKDYSRCPPDRNESALESLASHSDSSIKNQRLPTKLNAMLSDPNCAHIICWMPHGRAWRILKPKTFVSDVLPKYFESCNYGSFVRLVNAWGFRRFSSGPDRHAYYHELFLRNLPHLHNRMRRKVWKQNDPIVDKNNEPDLYAISRENPLPSPSNSVAARQVPSASSWIPQITQPSQAFGSAIAHHPLLPRGNDHLRAVAQNLGHQVPRMDSVAHMLARQQQQQHQQQQQAQNSLGSMIYLNAWDSSYLPPFSNASPQAQLLRPSRVCQDPSMLSLLYRGNAPSAEAHQRGLQETANDLNNAIELRRIIAARRNDPDFLSDKGAQKKPPGF